MVLFAALLLFFLSLSSRIGMHADESQWIAHSRSFEHFLAFDPHDAYWQPAEVNLTQPSLARYFIALGRLAGGFDADHLNGPWDFGQSDGENVRAGNMPAAELLHLSRIPMSLLAAAAVTLLAGLVSRVAGRVGACLFVLLMIANPLEAEFLNRAMGESPLTFFLSLGVLCGARQLEPARENGAWRLLQSGVCAGCAASCKLNGGFLLVAIVMLEMSVWWRARAAGYGFFRLLANLLTTSVAAGAIFWALNPFLYLNPLAHSRAMYEFRLEEIAMQQRNDPDSSIHSLGQSLRIAPSRVLGDYAPLPASPLTVPVNGILLLAGVLAVASSVRRVDESRPVALSLLTVSAIVGAPPLFTPLDWDRYYFLPVLFATIYISVGISLLAGRFATSKGDI
jgi:4-amino-4-deoxy-L-arabinose transferase-like glycosyltransferase